MLTSFSPGYAAAPRSLHVATQGSVLTFDPHAYLESLTQSVLLAVYEPLVRFNRSLAVEPALATSYERVTDETWRFHVRANARFHDGSRLTADDVVFSVNRARSPRAPIRALINSIKNVRKIDEATVDITTHQPHPTLDRDLTLLYVMSRRWAVDHDAEQPVDVRKGERSHASVNANGTGPFILKSMRPGAQVTLTRNPNWWDRPTGNVGQVFLEPVANDSTRLSALLAGQVDLIDPLPLQDALRVARLPGVTVTQREASRTIFLGFDQRNDELSGTSVKGHNPFKDLRVRLAFAHAIDIESIRSKLMHGAATPAGLLIGPTVIGYNPSLDTRPAYDLEAAKRLLAEAGYPDGFDLRLDCPNDRYVNDEALCHAISAMLARIGVRLDVAARSSARHFGVLLSGKSPFYLLGWITPTYDGLDALNAVAATPDGTRGLVNFGGYSNPRLDKLIDHIRPEGDSRRRDELIGEALRIHRDEVGHIVLHRQWLTSAMRADLQTFQLPDELLRFEWMSVR